MNACTHCNSPDTDLYGLMVVVTITAGNYIQIHFIMQLGNRTTYHTHVHGHFTKYPGKLAHCTGVYMYIVECSV